MGKSSWRHQWRYSHVIGMVIAIGTTIAIARQFSIDPEHSGAIDNLDSSPVEASTAKEDNLDAGSNRSYKNSDPQHNHDPRTITFPGGSKVEVVWRRRPTEAFNLTEPVAQHYTSLRRKAEAGNRFAALNLHAVLEGCRQAYDNEDAQKAAVELAYQTHMLQTAEMPEPMRIGEPEKLEEYIQIALRDPYRNCQGITAEQKAESLDWLKMAADLGHSLAMIEYSRTLNDGNAAEEYLMNAWESGDAEALRFLAERYQASYDSGVTPESNVKAYAAYYAYTRILESGLTDHGSIANRWLSRNKQDLASMTEKMQAYEIEEAVKLAEEMIRENRKCCFSM